jgi:ribose 1,5-bisphosphokinase PhnN
MREEPKVYIDALRQRMLSRGRGSDHVEGRLIMAEEYRKLYMRHSAEIGYINNSDGRREAAGADVARIIFEALA